MINKPQNQRISSPLPIQKKTFDFEKWGRQLYQKFLHLDRQFKLLVIKHREEVRKSARLQHENSRLKEQLRVAGEQNGID